MDTQENAFHVQGVPVQFPYTPYRAQNALMHAVISAVRTQTHTLIESPTGTGKTIALLCSTLAIQKALQKENNKFEEPKPVPKPEEKKEEKQLQQEDETKSPNETPQLQLCTLSNPNLSDDSDFQPRKKFRDVSWQKPPEKKRKQQEDEKPANAFMLDYLHGIQRDDPLDAQMDADITQSSEEATQQMSKKIPRIFYATRTHNQVAQAIAELRKTEYRPKISVLASRREYCIREEIRSTQNRDEICKELVKGKGCQHYFQSSELACHSELQNQAWDIEELNELGNRHGACPYYASHELYQNAELVFCPYSFLVDPIVREARGINLAGDIIILDEAHNIENYARESAGFVVNMNDVKQASDEVGKLLENNEKLPVDLKEAYEGVRNLQLSLLDLVDQIINSNYFKQDESHEKAILEEKLMMETLANAGIVSNRMKYWECAHDFIVRYGDGKEVARSRILREKKPIIELTPDDNGTAEGSGNGETTEREKEGTGERKTGYGYGADPFSGVHDSCSDENNNSTEDSSRERRRRGNRRKRHLRNIQRDERKRVAKCVTITHMALITLKYMFSHSDDFTLVVVRRIENFRSSVSLQLVCLNAAVSFREISGKARSVIVTSGTLTPIASFAGELGTEFATTKSLPHVIDVSKQLYVAVVSEGPGKVSFDATFRGSATFAFQDSLGDALIEYCQVVPKGVLVFFPSYRMMDQLTSRWRGSSVMRQLEETKGAIFIEPTQRSDGFDMIITEYQKMCCSEKGAILFAVCRGKLSEGVDFRDEMSRGVVIVGIPYPYVGDTVVSRKRLWNNRMRSQDNRKELQSGEDWYQSQAFRALNQALGRAVRHRYDYCAILLIDARYGQERVISQLSPWARKALRNVSGSHDSVLRGLQHFYSTVQQQIAMIAAHDNK